MSMDLSKTLNAQVFGEQRHWPASLFLAFDEKQGRTRMHKMDFKGPLRVQRPFYPEGEVCHSYLLHPPGGIVSGDDLAITIECHANSHALITTPSAGKIYSADSCGVVQRQQVQVNVDQAICEWLPMETIVFDGAHAQLNTQINISGDARFCGIEMICLGRAASQLPFEQGSIEQSLSLYHNGIPLLHDRLQLDTRSSLLPANAGFNKFTASGTLLAYGLSDAEANEWVSLLRDSLPPQSPLGWLSVTYRLGLLIVRYLGDDSEYGMHHLRKAWAQLRPALLNRPACPPRIWST